MTSFGANPGIIVELEANIAKLQADLNAAKAAVAKTTQEMDQTVKRSSLFDEFKGLKGTIRTVGDAFQYVQAGLGTASALAASMRGEFEESQTILESLPGVFGQIARSGRMAFEMFGKTTTKNDVEKAERELADIEADIERSRRSGADVRRLEMQRGIILERDARFRARKEADLAIFDVDESMRRAGNVTGEAVAAERAKIREEMKAIDEGARNASIQANMSPEYVASLEASRKRLRDMDQAQVQRLRREMEEQIREREANVARIEAEFQKSIADIEAAESRKSQRKALSEEERAVRERLREMQGTTARDFIRTAQTAIGEFTSAQPGASAALLSNSREQTKLQQRLVEIGEAQSKILDGIEQGGWQ